MDKELEDLKKGYEAVIKEVEADLKEENRKESEKSREEEMKKEVEKFIGKKQPNVFDELRNKLS